MKRLFKFNEKKIEFEVFLLEESLKRYIKESNNGNVVYFESIEQFVNNFLVRLKGILANNRKLDELDISALKTINKGFPFMSNVHVMPIDYLNQFSSDEVVRIDERFKEVGFKVIEDVGYIRLDARGDRIIDLSDIIDRNN